MRKTICCILLCAGAASAQVDIKSQSKKEVVLIRGGPAQKVRFVGSDFDSVREIQVIKDDRRIRTLRAELKPISKGMVDLELQAGADLAPGPYKLNFIYVKDHERVPVDVSVANPPNPKAAAQPRPEGTPKPGWFPTKNGP